MEQNDIILVRVGGGYMSLSDFVEQYTCVELEKLGRQPTHRNLHKDFVEPPDSVTSHKMPSNYGTKRRSPDRGGSASYQRQNSRNC